MPRVQAPLAGHGDNKSLSVDTGEGLLGDAARAKGAPWPVDHA
jgi:hypothetical protein